VVRRLLSGARSLPNQVRDTTFVKGR